MKVDPEIAELGVRFKIETAHVHHVARLALKLYDGFALSGKKADRRILKAAALLHDVGYATEPEHHVDAGVELLLANPISSFSQKDWRSVAAVVSLHRRDWRPVLNRPQLLEFGNKCLARLKMLAAILRIADGLDHGRLQDTSIISCRRGRYFDKVTVKCRWYCGNVPWAEGKADLWEAAFNRNIKLVGYYGKSKLPFAGVVSEADPTKDAVRKILYSQFCVMRDNLVLMKEGDNPEYLHDFRVAMRRFRTGVKLFRTVVQHSGLCKVAKGMGTLSDEIGCIRDIHLKALYIEHMEQDITAANERLKELLDDHNVDAMVRFSGQVLRTEFNGAIGFERSHRFAGYVEAIFNRIMNEVLEGGADGIRQDDTLLHALRKRCRRGRYIAEFAAPARVPGARKAAKYLKPIATALGEIRDIQAILDHRSPDEKLIVSEEELRNQLAKQWDKFEMNWNKFK
jgi:CHAD domain-containing protein